MNTVDVDCYHCHSRESEFYDTENGFNLVRCVECGLLYVNPRPVLEEITEAARTGLHGGQECFDMTDNFSEQRVEKFLGILSDLGYESLKNSESLEWLDIGCGHGEFLKAISIFSDERVKTKGLEPNIHKQKSARKNGLDVNFFDLKECGERFDFISSLNVYSHLPDPVEEIGTWCGFLKEDGEILIQTGDSADLKRKDHHKPYYLPDHLSFVSEEILIGILQDLDMKIINIHKYRFAGFPEFNLRNIVREIRRLVSRYERANFKFLPKHPNRDMWIRAKKK